MRILKNAMLLCVAAALFAGSYFILTKGPCDSPIVYHIGAFDAKFGLSRAAFVADTAEAAAIWQKVVGKPLFVYDESRGLPVNLVYDSRQATTDTSKTLSAAIDRTVASADSVKAELAALRVRYESERDAYGALVAGFQSRLAAYNDAVSRYNAEKRPSPAEYERLQSEKASLEDLRSQASSRMAAVNSLAGQVNALVDRYNSLISAANADARKVNQTAGKEFEQGDYVRDASGERIDVYEFDGQTRLVRLLAHEFGHAVGLEHDADPASIMYYLNAGSSLTPSAGDAAALRKLCGIP
ncbi:MAG TPA: matrixin family metalloprotease [Candidatus Paceibacterota bacterium]|nr:matrixin family metalloprotease [Candidatus Paceibacterota bacterium]